MLTIKTDSKYLVECSGYWICPVGLDLVRRKEYLGVAKELNHLKLIDSQKTSFFIQLIGGILTKTSHLEFGLLSKLFNILREQLAMFGGGEEKLGITANFFVASS